MVWAVKFCICLVLSTISKKLQDDGEATTPATPFPGIQSKQAEAFGNKSTPQTRLVGSHMQAWQLQIAAPV